MKTNKPVAGMVPGSSFVLDVDTLRVLGDNVLIELDMEEKTTPGGVIIPPGKKSREAPMYGWVRRAGKGARVAAGAFIPMIAKPGDRVIFTRYGGHEIYDNNGDEFRIISQFNIWATVSGEQIIPQGNRVLVEISSKDGETDWGFIIPDTAEDSRETCTAGVVRSGPGTIDDRTGKMEPTGVRPGDEVVMTRFAGMAVREGGKKYLLVGPLDLQAVIQ